jgi:nucleoside triphosphate diphosphatase
MADDAGYFNLRDVAEGLTAKLVRRHPHVFGDVDAETPDAVLRNWEQIKVQEKEQKPRSGSLLEEIPRSMPATMEASKLGSKAAKVGFDWQDASGLFAKMDEELAELMVEVEAKHSENVEAEFGDLLFTAMNLARHLNVDPESALRRSNAKFRTRFAAMEREAGGAEILKQLAPEELERMWEQAKSVEKEA